MRKDNVFGMAGAVALAAMMAAAAPALAQQQSPMLDDLVAAGTIPPVAERLPANPLVITPVESVGTYGGTWRRAFNGVSDHNGPSKLTNEGLTWYNADLTLRANLVESWETSDDAKSFVLHLRKGLCWSDGEPLTSADARWFWEHVLANSTITPAMPCFASLAISNPNQPLTSSDPCSEASRRHSISPLSRNQKANSPTFSEWS